MNNLILCDDWKHIKNFDDNFIDLIIIDPPYLVTKENWDQKEVVSVELSQELFRILNLLVLYMFGVELARNLNH